MAEIENEIIEWPPFEEVNILHRVTADDLLSSVSTESANESTEEDESETL